LGNGNGNFDSAKFNFQVPMNGSFVAHSRLVKAKAANTRIPFFIYAFPPQGRIPRGEDL
jgi:hypothetical protein